MSDFAQAIFRFRKLNKGTYLSIILINEDIKLSNKKYTTDDIYELLKKNQEELIINQRDGIRYQILKTIISKIDYEIRFSFRFQSYPKPHLVPNNDNIKLKGDMIYSDL
jgi:hypothetical protein